MSTMFGYKLPKAMQREFADVIQKISEEEGGEVAPERIMECFQAEYLDRKTPYELLRVKFEEDQEEEVRIQLAFKYKGEEIVADGQGEGPIDALKSALRQGRKELDFTIMDFDEHALSEGSKAKAAAYIQMRDNKTGKITFGVGVSSNITKASFRGIFSALNRLTES